MKIFGAESSHRFGKGFIIESAHFQTLERKIRERFPDSDIHYDVIFNNTSKYKTTSLDVLLLEENNPANNIEKIVLVAKYGDNVKLIIVFQKGEKTLLSITGADKDSIFLLFNEMKSYIDKEIAVVRVVRLGNSSTSLYVQIGLVIGIIVGPSIHSEITSLRGSENIILEAQNALESYNLVEKIDFLIQQEIKRNEANSSIGIDLIIVLGVLTVIAASTVILLASLQPPHDYFCIGKEKSVLEKKQKTRQNIFWIVIIGTLVAVFAAVIANFININSLFTQW